LGEDEIPKMTLLYASELEALLGITILLSALYMQGQSFVDPTIRAILVQSLLLSVLFAIIAIQTNNIELFYLAILTIVMRGITVPRIMLYQVRKFKHTLRESGTGQKIPAFILIGIILIILGYFLYRTILEPFIPNSQVSVALILLLLGFLLIVTRRNALVQMTGYIEEENAILYAGALIAPTIPLLIEFAVVLDIFGVVIIGVILSAQRDVFHTLEPADLEQLTG
jgi:hydrogenase-4 component E